MAIRTDAVGDNLKRTSGLPSSSTTLSFCAWIYLTSDRNDYQNFFFVEHTGFGSQDIFLSTDSDGTTLKLFDGGAALTGPAMSTGTWYFVAFSRTNTSRGLYYADVTASGLTAVTDSTTQTISDTHDALWWMNDVYNEYVNGRIVACKLWDGVALTQAEFEAERWRIVPARFDGLYGWWPMFPGSGERVRDYSGNGRDLTEAGTITDEDPPPVSWGSKPVLLGVTSSATTHDGAAALTGTGSITSVGQVICQATFSVTGVGVITPVGQAILQGQATVTGVGVLTANGEAIREGASSLVGVGTITIAAEAIREGAAALTGVGVLSAEGQVIATGQASLTGVGVITANGEAIREAASSLVGVGSLTSDGSVILAGAVSLVGVGTLTATGDIDGSGAASLEGIATLTVSGEMIRPGAAALVGSAILTSAGERIVEGAITMVGLAQIGSLAQLVNQGQVSLTGLAVLGVSSSVIYQAQVSLLGVGLLTIVGDTTPAVTGIVDLSLRSRSTLLSLPVRSTDLSLRARAFDLTLPRR